MKPHPCNNRKYRDDKSNKQWTQWKIRCQFKVPVCTNNSVWLLVWFVRSAVTFQTFCSGLGFYETHHLKDKIRLRRWPFPLFGVHFKHLLFVVTRFMVGAHPPSVRLSLSVEGQKGVSEREIQADAHRKHHMTSLLVLHIQAEPMSGVTMAKHQGSTIV